MFTLSDSIVVSVVGGSASTLCAWIDLSVLWVKLKNCFNKTIFVKQSRSPKSAHHDVPSTKISVKNLSRVTWFLECFYEYSSSYCASCHTAITLNLHHGQNYYEKSICIIVCMTSEVHWMTLTGIPEPKSSTHSPVHFW